MKIIIDKNADKLTIKKLLKDKMKLSSRLIKHLKKYNDGIILNGAHAHVTSVLGVNDELILDFSDREEDVNEYLERTFLPLDIIYEDENITVVNKSAFMPTHQSHNHYSDTLANALAYRYSNRPYVFRAINRLDKNTSGVVITANNKLYAEILASKLRNGKFKKEYIAIVEGRMIGGGVIDAPIARMGESIIEREVRPDGEYAYTEYNVLLSCDDISLLRLSPITGRTHQLRVHLSYIGHPILGDSMYGSASELIDRQALHASRISVADIGEYIAPIPDDMMKIIRRYFSNAQDLL